MWGIRNSSRVFDLSQTENRSNLTRKTVRLMRLICLIEQILPESPVNSLSPTILDKEPKIEPLLQGQVFRRIFVIRVRTFTY
jgi:hypothetical protein